MLRRSPINPSLPRIPGAVKNEQRSNLVLDPQNPPVPSYAVSTQPPISRSDFHPLQTLTITNSQENKNFHRYNFQETEFFSTTISKKHSNFLSTTTSSEQQIITNSN